MTAYKESSKHSINKAEVNRIAFNHSLPADLIRAIILVESSGNPCAARFEPTYKYLWDCKNKHPFQRLSPQELNSNKHPSGFTAECGSRDTEWTGQKTSWGPMQVMGAVAREYGFLGYFPVLCGPLGVEYGAIHLVKLRDRYYARYGWDGVVAAYNAGSPVKKGEQYANQRYVDKVFNALETIGGKL